MTRLAEALVALGVEPGDRVAIFLPMSPEVAIASHACAHIGAIQVPVFSGFAAPAVAQRLRRVGGEGRDHRRRSLRRGREVPMKAIVEEARREAPPVEHVIVAPWDEAVADCPARWSRSRSSPSTRTCSPTRRARPGKPKGVVHVQGGFLVSIAREVAYQADVHPGDVIHFVTDMGWIMGPWTVVGARRARRDGRLRRGRARLAAPTGCGGSSRRSASRSSASRPRSSAR